jgi:hypothetical protein
MKRILGLMVAAMVSFGAEKAEVKNISVNGGIEDGKARLVIEAALQGLIGADREKLLYATTLNHSVLITREKETHEISAKFDVLQGEPKEIALTISGNAEIKSVAGEFLQDWSVRQETNGVRSLVIRPKRLGKKSPNESGWPTNISVTITAERPTKLNFAPQTLLSLAPPNATLLNGYLKVEFAPELEIQVTNAVGLIPIESKLLPEAMRKEGVAELGGEVRFQRAQQPEILAYRFQGSAYSLPVVISLVDPDARRVVLRDFQLVGRITNSVAEFTLSAKAAIKNPKGGRIAILSGNAALAALPENADWKVTFENGRYFLVFEKAGEFPVRLRFDAAVSQNGAWKSVDFVVAPGTVAPMLLRGLEPETQFEFTSGAKPERVGNEFRSFLPADGSVRLSWKEAAKESEGKLFYSAEMLSQISVSPGLMRQTAILNGKVMQGELTKLTLNVRGDGNVTAVSGANVLAWSVEGTNASERKIVVTFNQAQKDAFELQLQMQSELGVFPQAMDAMRVAPEGATRFAGHVRVVNEGAVRLEIVQASGLSQISPEQFPETDATKAAFVTQGNQRFAFRFSTAEYALRIQADNVIPEVSASELLAYHLGETELAIDAEIELEIREAPLREVTLRTPKGFAVARLNAPGSNDYFLREPEGATNAELRIVYGQPISDRQVIQFRLERNSALGAPAWDLARIDVVKARSTRGHMAVSADSGFRVTTERTAGLNEMATAFFPRKLTGLQAAFRITDANWQAAMRVERLPQTIHADVFHLFSIGEGIAYGSSTINFTISGAPVSTFLVSLSDEYFNVEFTGKDLRSNWQRTTNGYVVTLNTPVSGTYTLLVTYERPFKRQGDTLTFTGARPIDAQSEQGHTIVVSAYQFRVTPVNVSPGLLPLETAEVPAEYRLFFDAPILAAYRYNARPFNLQLALTPLAQGETVGMVVDRATLSTRISKEGEILTDAQYFVKARGNPNLRLTLPEGTTLWSAMVNGTNVTPVKDGAAHLIRLPQRADPNTVQTVDFKLASRAKTADRMRVGAPIIAAPVLLAEWKVDPDTRQRLIYKGGSLMPSRGSGDTSGFKQLAELFRAPNALGNLLSGIFFVVFALAVWRWTARAPESRARRMVGTLVGIFAILLALVQFTKPAAWITPLTTEVPGLTFVAPVQQSGSALSIDVANVSIEPGFWSGIAFAWPAALAILVWVYAIVKGGWQRSFAVLLGWTLLAWAALRTPGGVPLFFGVLISFLILHVVIPAVRGIFRTAPVAAAAALIVLRCANVSAQPMAESVTQQIRVQDQFAFATATIQWQATNNQALPIIFTPAVVTGVKYSTNDARLTNVTLDRRRGQQLIAQKNGLITVEVSYQVYVNKGAEGGFALPTQPGLVNQVRLTLPELDVDVSSTNAVSVVREPSTNGTVAHLTLAPGSNTWIAWKPRSREFRNEKAVFFAEFHQLFAPTAGVIEGAHAVEIRPAQGELSELIFDVPAGATISDVSDAAKDVSVWRFDPDTRKLRVTLAKPTSQPFTLIVRSQVATGPLPFEQTVGLLSVNGAAGQVGSAAIATGNEVQLDTVSVDSLSPINLEDFPGSALITLQSQIPGLTVRRAFRYSDARATLKLKASAVEPDVRVETQQTLSLGEDRTVLALNAAVEITRAGIFRLSFVLPVGFDVETIGGAAMSHWTELKSDDGRIITLHLKGKTDGQQQFNISLAGAGVRATNGFVVPRVVFREANKQRGQLVIVPEQGMRLQLAQREDATQLDPENAGIRQKGVLAFRLLQASWRLTLDIEQVNAWVQVTSLQHVNVTEAQLKVAANLQYQIENTGLKSLRVLAPANAEGLRFRGDQVADFLPVANSMTNGMQVWEVKLHRRIMGKYLLQATWQTQLAQGSTNVAMRGAQALDANLQRGFVTVKSTGRLQVRAEAAPEMLLPAEWQSIPRALRQDIEASGASFTFRLVDANFSLALILEAHEATKLLPARVTGVTLTSVISDEGVMLTQVKMDLIPGDKRLLQFTLPAGESKFWFAFVNQNGVWPWLEKDRILIPLEQQSQPNKPTSVEIFYASKIGDAGGRKLNLQLLGPKFDLPLENINWQVYLDDKWRLADWGGTLQLQSDAGLASPVAVDVQSYLQNESRLRGEKSKAAEEQLNLANSLLANGDPQQARRAFQSAYGLSAHDDAFNEDARVQLHNLKLQQALIGLNVRQSGGEGEAAAPQASLRDMLNRKDATYTQQQAKQIIESNSADENAALMKLAERLVQQQDAAIAAPAVIHASIPQQGRILTFHRAVLVDPWADLQIGLKARANATVSIALRAFALATIFAVFAGLAFVAKRVAGARI